MFAEGKKPNGPRACAGFAVAERARFELAEEREPLDGLANRCLGPLDYLSSFLPFYWARERGSTREDEKTTLTFLLCEDVRGLSGADNP